MKDKSVPVPGAVDAASAFAVGAPLVDALRQQLPSVAELTVAAVIDNVPSYADAWDGPMGQTIAEAVQLALAGFLHLVGSGRASDAGTPLQPALDGAYALGRGEARSGRPMDALLAAYRVGARIAWRELSQTAVSSRLPAVQLARFAELVFAYIDELSAASVAGHSDELATTGRVRERLLERLAQALLDGVAEDELAETAQRADWSPPESLIAVLLPSSQMRAARAGLDRAALSIGVEPGEDEQPLTALLVPSTGAASRQFLFRHLVGRQAVVGPDRPWTAVAASYRRALRVHRLVHTDDGAPIDTESYLARLVCTADGEALADLRARALAPLAGLRGSSADRLVETLRSWLLHQGRREDIAADLSVHPQTVRYRMTQLRERYGERLQDPRVVEELTIALAMDT